MMKPPILLIEVIENAQKYDDEKLKQISGVHLLVSSS